MGEKARNFLRIVLLALSAAACGPEPEISRPSSASPAPVRLRGESIDVQRALGHIRTLAGEIGPRLAGSPAEARAAEYVERELAALGLAVRRQAFPLPDGGESANVVAQPAILDPQVPHLIVGAHLDTVPGSPGANDNASGVAVLIELARALQARPAPPPVVWVTFGAEEASSRTRGASLNGSKHFVSALTPEEIANLGGMLNLDMVGRGAVLISARRVNTPRGLHERLLRLAPALGVPLREELAFFPSDYLPFGERGVHAAWLWTGTDPAYHSPRDTPEGVTPVSLDMTGRLALAALRSTSARDRHGSSAHRP